jgi:hypothetical protein
VNPERRTWSTPVRTPWNPLIHGNLQAIDHHVLTYFETGDIRHLEMADTLRQYVHCLKTWIHEWESRYTQDGLEESAGQYAPSGSVPVQTYQSLHST